MIKVKLRFTKVLILFIGVMSLLAFLNGIKSCHTNSSLGIDVTPHTILEQLVRLSAFMACITVLLLNQKYKIAVERLLCNQTIAYYLLSMFVVAVAYAYEGLVGDNIRLFEEIVIQVFGISASIYLFMIWLYAFVLVDRFRKGDRIAWYLGLLFFGIIVTPIAVYKLVPENVTKYFDKNKTGPNKAYDQIAGTGGATD